MVLPAYVILVGAVVFWPTFIIAMAMLRAPGRAFVLYGTFTLGSMLGALLSLLAAMPLIRRTWGDAQTYYTFAFAGLGAIAGGVLAVHLLGKLAGHSLWRRP
jgi:hypothetical protein